MKLYIYINVDKMKTTKINRQCYKVEMNKFGMKVFKENKVNTKLPTHQKLCVVLKNVVLSKVISHD